MEVLQPFQPASSSSCLPPGCCFSPSDEQILCFYLPNKTTASISPNSLANGVSPGYNLIKDLDPFDYDPFDLPESACFSYGSRGRKKHWYYYSVSVFSEKRERIRMKSGYWRRKRRAREAIIHRGVVLGMKTSFVFYWGNSIENAVKTNWIMYEYALGDHFKASFVLHRVFVRGWGHGISGNGLSAYGDGSVSAVCHNGNQQDGIPVTNGIAGHEMGCAEKPNCVLVTDPDTTLQVPSEAYPCGMMAPSPVTPTGSISILDGDFLEINDLDDQLDPEDISR
ncbi:NAC transcription factor 29, partial [Cucurbita argyrosperma subsp. sororia]